MSIEQYTNTTQLGGANLPGLDTQQKAAAERFAEAGLPSTRDEEWKYTNLAALRKVALEPASWGEQQAVDAALVQRHLLEDGSSHRVVLVDGLLSPELSGFDNLPDGLTITSLRDGDVEGLDSTIDLSDQTPPFAFLNTAHLQDGVVVRVARNAVVGAPIEIVWVGTSAGSARASHPRLFVVAGENSECTLVETYVGDDGTYLTNAVVELIVGASARVDHYKVQKEGLAAYHIANMRVTQERDSSFSTHSFSFGALLARNDINTSLNGSGITTTVNGLYITGGTQHVDHHTSIDHTKPHCNSFQTYKGILSGRSTAVFNGKIFVRQDAQKTDAKQSNRNLLLSPNACVNTKPQLEIWADDVRCTHGATIGQLERDALFYLRARGISKSDAEHLLVFAFANEVLDNVKCKPLRRVLDRELVKWLP